MQKRLLVFIATTLAISLITKNATAQSEIDTTVDLDVLTIPNSPAFSLLGISPSDVDKPTTPTDFAFSIANATNNLSQLPANYAIEFLPLSFFQKHKMSYAKFTNNAEGEEKIGCLKKLRNNIAQTFIISSGFSSYDSIDTTVPNYIQTRNGTGLKFSLIRGKIDTAFSDYKDSIVLIRKTLSDLHNVALVLKDSLRNNDSTLILLANQRQQVIDDLIRNNSDNLVGDSIKSIRRDLLQKSLVLISKERENVLDSKVEELITNKENSLYDKGRRLKMQIENIKYKRYGWMLDFAGGIVLGFRNNDFQNSIVQQYAFWFNGGYSCKKYFSILGLVRNSNVIDAVIDENGNTKDKNITDLGGKIEFSTSDGKLSFNGEVIERIASEYKPIYRYTFNASYQVGKNQALTFSIGKAFAGKEQVGGSLIAALNYVKMFGSKRKITP